MDNKDYIYYNSLNKIILFPKYLYSLKTCYNVSTPKDTILLVTPMKQLKIQIIMIAIKRNLTQFHGDFPVAAFLHSSKIIKIDNDSPEMKT